jgi:hypothetical protein
MRLVGAPCKYKVGRPDTPAGDLGLERPYEQDGEKMRAAMKVLGVECPHATEKLDREFVVVGMAQFWLKLKIEKWRSLVTMHF